jgi:hypothetical protein
MLKAEAAATADPKRRAGARKNMTETLPSMQAAARPRRGAFLSSRESAFASVRGGRTMERGGVVRRHGSPRNSHTSVWSGRCLQKFTSFSVVMRKGSQPHFLWMTWGAALWRPTDVHVLCAAAL